MTQGLDQESVQPLNESNMDIEIDRSEEQKEPKNDDSKMDIDGDTNTDA